MAHPYKHKAVAGHDARIAGIKRAEGGRSPGPTDLYDPEQMEAIENQNRRFNPQEGQAASPPSITNDMMNVPRPFGSAPHGSIDAQGKVHGMKRGGKTRTRKRADGGPTPARDNVRPPIRPMDPRVARNKAAFEAAFPGGSGETLDSFADRYARENGLNK